jgi:hypothetical protein
MQEIKKAATPVVEINPVMSTAKVLVRKDIDFAVWALGKRIDQDAFLSAESVSNWDPLNEMTVSDFISALDAGGNDTVDHLCKFLAYYEVFTVHIGEAKQGMLVRGLPEFKEVEDSDDNDIPDATVQMTARCLAAFVQEKWPIQQAPQFNVSGLKDLLSSSGGFPVKPQQLPFNTLVSVNSGSEKPLKEFPDLCYLYLLLGRLDRATLKSSSTCQFHQLTATLELVTPSSSRLAL